MTHDDIIREKKLPSVNQCVRSKKHNTIWRVIGKKELWLNASDDPKGIECRSTPAVYLYYLRVKGGSPGIFKMLGFTYTLQENTFEANWEVID
ncbi:MAG: hypothetical protein E4H48_01850 [Syntrophobacterales bacterium]|nr:MAG: hypothetical protein E4H48_01850 [Syntrophobacterales bacterium]